MGGPGSGNFGHSGRPGERGGSGGGGSENVKVSGKMADLQSRAGNVPIRRVGSDDPRFEETVPGFYDEDDRVVYIQEGVDPDSPVVSHELGHALDSHLGGDPNSHFTDTTEWSAAVRADQKEQDHWDRSFVGRGSYYGQRKEVFAELTSLLTKGEGAAIRAERLLRAFPRSTKLVSALLESSGNRENMLKLLALKK